MSDKTLAMIKPDAIAANYMGKIMDRAIGAGFEIVAMKLTHLTKEKAQQFYAVHRDKPFFDDLTDFMSSGPIVALMLKKENAIQDWRDLMGATNPEEAEEGTLRADFASNIQENAVHGADSEENAQREANFFFSQLERFE